MRVRTREVNLLCEVCAILPSLGKSKLGKLGGFAPFIFFFRGQPATIPPADSLRLLQRLVLSAAEQRSIFLIAQLALSTGRTAWTGIRE
jgi:hypothetical protein